MIALALRRMRQYHGRTQHAMAHTLNMSLKQYQRLEKGKRPVSQRLCQQFAEAFSLQAVSLVMLAENLRSGTPIPDVADAAALAAVREWHDKKRS